MSYAHYEHLFDYRYKDLETGKLDTDKLCTLNSECMSYERANQFHELYCINYDHSRFPSEDHSFKGLEEIYNRYKFPEREKELQKQRDKERIHKEKELEVQRKRQREREEYEEFKRQRVRELEEYRVRVAIREEQLIKERQQRLAQQQQRTFDGSYSGQRIITSRWNVKQG